MTNYKQNWRLNNIEKAREQANNWVKKQIEKNPEEWKAKMRERAKKWRAAHLEECRAKEREKSRLRRLKDKEEDNRIQREYRKNNPDKVKQYYLKGRERSKVNARKKLLSKYGLTEDSYNNLLTLQEGKCAICKLNLNEPKIDHCHSDGKTRSLLCQECNFILGYVEKQLAKNKNILEEFTNYLKTHNCWEKH